MSRLLETIPLDSVLTVVAIGLLASLGAAVVTAWTTADRRRHGPTIRRLGRDLGLRRQDLRLLRQLARSVGHTHPGAFLISRGCFDHAARGFVNRHGQAARLRTIRQTIFDR